MHTSTLPSYCDGSSRSLMSPFLQNTNKMIDKSLPQLLLFYKHSSCNRSHSTQLNIIELHSLTVQMILLQAIVQLEGWESCACIHEGRATSLQLRQDTPTSLECVHPEVLLVRLQSTSFVSEPVQTTFFQTIPPGATASKRIFLYPVAPKFKFKN